MIPEAYNKIKGYYRGYSAIRSDDSSNLNYINTNYYSYSNRNGLWLGLNQEFFF